jgi:predicted nucleotidyltransferase
MDRKHLLKQLNHIAEQLLREKPEVQDVRLFGSVSYGKATGLSDVDILPILKECMEKDPVRRILLYLPYFSVGRDVDLLIYTVDELNSFLVSGNLTFNRYGARASL